MKKLIFILFGLSLLSYSTVKSQEIATIGEIYDYEIGDEFHSFTDYDLFPTVFEKLIITRITDKIIHPDIDSITYYRHKSVVKYDLYNGDTTYQEIFDTIGYHHLDSLINLGSWYSVFIDPELYNGREINRGYWINQPPVQRNYNEYILGCGGSYSHVYYYMQGGSTTHNLVYFKKGEEEWGNPLVVGILEPPIAIHHFQIIPNPANDQIMIHTPQQAEPGKLQIFNASGQLMKKTDVVGPEQNIEITNLPSGIYFVKLVCDKTRSMEKLIVR